jgi:hypothetical protein
MSNNFRKSGREQVGQKIRCISVVSWSSTSLNPVPNAQVCVYLTVHTTKLQLQTDENINIVIEFNPYMPKFSKSKTQATQ